MPVLEKVNARAMAVIAFVLIMMATTLGAGLTAASATGTTAEFAEEDVAPTARLKASQARIGADRPPIYANGCHVGNRTSVPRACYFGNAASGKRVLLFGDSHAAHWFGAVRKVSDQNKYQMVNLTKSACTSVDVRLRLYRQSKNHTTCNKWRAAAFSGLNQNKWGKIDVAVVSNWHYHQVLKGKKVLKGQARLKEWRNGVTRMLRVLSKRAKKVVILRDSPQFSGGPDRFVSCVKKNSKKPQKCGRSAKKALNASVWKVERQVAKQFANVTTVDLSTPYCKGGFCNPVNSGLLAFRDDNHFAHTFMTREMSKSLAPHIKAAFAN